MRTKGSRSYVSEITIPENVMDWCYVFVRSFAALLPSSGRAKLFSEHGGRRALQFENLKFQIGGKHEYPGKKRQDLDNLEYPEKGYCQRTEQDFPGEPCDHPA